MKLSRNQKIAGGVAVAALAGFIFYRMRSGSTTVPQLAPAASASAGASEQSNIPEAITKLNDPIATQNFITLADAYTKAAPVKLTAGTRVLNWPNAKTAIDGMAANSNSSVVQTIIGVADRIGTPWTVSLAGINGLGNVAALLT